MLYAHGRQLRATAKHMPYKEITPKAQIQFFVLLNNFISVAVEFKMSTYWQKF
jgi:hypothetical protein